VLQSQERVIRNEFQVTRFATLVRFWKGHVHKKQGGLESHTLLTCVARGNQQTWGGYKVSLSSAWNFAQAQPWKNQQPGSTFNRS